ncbi:MAG: tRNA (guanosine(46)-N7)-methyltransferase TrmB [Sporichthyaceae bacterium]
MSRPPSPAAADPAAHGPVRSFKRRASRVTSSQRAALDRHWPSLGMVVDGAPLELTDLFGRVAPVVLEIGFGMGEATAAMAAAQPAFDVLAVDVHTPGQGNLLRLLVDAGLTNLRVVDGDATVLLRESLPPASLSVVRAFFPDPWPKARHVKRRLVDAAFAALAADRLVDGGLLHVATDMPAYADQVADVLAREPLLEPVDAPWRAQTRFERRGAAAGRPAHDLAARRVSRTP